MINYRVDADGIATLEWDMIPLLATREIRTLREARAASERTLYAKVAY